MKQALCRAFCDGIEVRAVPAGLAVSTLFAAPDGDRIGFYIEHDASTAHSRIADSGLTLPLLEASGFNLRSGTRVQALQTLLSEYGVTADPDAREFAIDNLNEKDVPAAALRFVAFLLRVRDFSLLTETRVASTFKDDVAALLRETINDRATIEEDVPISSKLEDFVPDFMVRARSRQPVAVFLGTSDRRVLEALFVQMRALYEVNVPCSVIALLENEKAIRPTIRQQASNRLTAVSYFRGDERASIQRIANEALGQTFGSSVQH